MNRKRGRKEEGRKAQAATEHMGLAGIILIAVLVLAYFISMGANTGGLQVKDAVKTIDDSVEGLSNIGAGSTDTVTVSSPGNVENVSLEACEDLGGDNKRCGAIKVIYADERVDFFTMKYFVWGSLDFLKSPGIHQITLYHDGIGGRIIFIECGDGVVNGWEECEYCDNGQDCDSGNCHDNICGPMIPGENDCTLLKPFYTGPFCMMPGEKMECLCDGEYCGDGTINGPEECEVDQDCIALYGSGYVCNNNCGCVEDDPGGSSGECGNGIIEDGEECDWPNLDGETCNSQGFSGGALDCYRKNHAQECTFNTNFCILNNGFCGDGTVRNSPGEECDDGNNLNGDGCDANCKFEDSDPCDSIVSYWKFDEESGTTLHDSTHVHDGTVNGQAAWETSKTIINGCNSIYYPAYSAYTKVDDSNDFNFEGNFSIELWAYLETGNSVKAPLFIHKSLSSYPPSYWSARGVAIVYDSAEGEIAAFIDDGLLAWPVYAPVQTDKWQHIVLSANKARTEIILCVSDDSDNINCVDGGEYTPTSDLDSAEDIYTGPGTSEYDFTGYIDELAVYDESMVKDRIREHILRIEGGWHGYCGEEDCYTSHQASDCGNGVPEFGEDCDDGSWTGNNDMCIIDVPNSWECKDAYCGDGYICNDVNSVPSCNTGPGDGVEECEVDQDCINIYGADYICRSDCGCEYSPGGGNCGNGIKEGDEECDDEDFGGLTCLDYNYPFGILYCNSDCEILPYCYMPECWDTEDNDDDTLIDYTIDPGCYAWDDTNEENESYNYCGDGQIDWPEQCEYTWQCDSMSGEVCDNTCMCKPGAAPYCGDGQINQNSEECETNAHCPPNEPYCRYCHCMGEFMPPGGGWDPGGPPAGGGKCEDEPDAICAPGDPPPIASYDCPTGNKVTCQPCTTSCYFPYCGTPMPKTCAGDECPGGDEQCDDENPLTSDYCVEECPVEGGPCYTCCVHGPLTGEEKPPGEVPH
jgi:cysteine-rich repeat protein